MARHTILYEAYKEKVGAWTYHNDFELPTHFQDLVTEHNAVRHAVGLLDLSHRAKFLLTGKDRVRFLHNMTTNDIKSLTPNQSCYTTMCTRQGRMIADMKVHMLEEALLIDTDATLRKTMLETLNKFIIMDDVTIHDVSNNSALIGVYGPESYETLKSVFTKAFFGPDTPILRELKVKEISHFFTCRSFDTGEDGYEIFMPTSLAVKAYKALKSKMHPIGTIAFNTLRLEAGTPLWGIDMDENYLPTEAGLEAQVISYTKGCYIGQEVIQRIKTYGEAAKQLVGLIVEGTIAPQAKDPLFRGEHKVGHVTSAILSPTLGKVLALGYVRKEHKTVKTKLIIQSGSYQLSAEVTALPFYKSPNLPKHTSPCVKFIEQSRY